MHRIEDMREETAAGKADGAEAAIPRGSAKKLSTSRFDVFTGMGISNVVMFAIIVARRDHWQSWSPSHHRFTGQAAAALKPIAGRMARTSLLSDSSVRNAGHSRPRGSGAAGLSGMLDRPRLFEITTQGAILLHPLRSGHGRRNDLQSALGQPDHALVFVAVINGVAAAPFLAVTCSSHPIGE